MRLTLVQTDTRWHDPETNRTRIEHQLGDLPAGHSDLIALPEMFTTGFTMDSATQAESMEGDSVQWMRALAGKLQATVAGTLVIRENNAFYNRLIWMPPDGAAQYYDKRHLFRMAGEDRAYAAGHERPVFRVKNWRVRPTICYDLRFPVWCRNDGENYDLLLCLANWPSPRHEAWTILSRARAIENLACVAVVNRVGRDQTDNLYLGSSMVIDAKGNTIADAGDTEGIVHAVLQPQDLVEFRRKFPVHKDADEFVLK
ncbi:MAG: amidohydrolase [Gammaproteobacteria bacterium]|nr:amidohydrolase [Gammaproteobacteria bacterium]